MYLHVFIITFAAWISFSFAQEPVESNHDLGPCNEENYGRRELIKGSDGKEIPLICSKDNGVYSWKEDAMETEIDDTNDVMEDVMLKREAATEFLQPRDRRSSLECWPSEAGDISDVMLEREADTEFLQLLRKYIGKNIEGKAADEPVLVAAGNR